MRKILCLLVLFGAFTASAQRFVRYFDTVTDMAASNPADPNVYVVVGGSVSFNDNQAARWKWVSGSVDPADGNTVVSTWAGGWPGKPAGRWKKINEASGIVIDTSGFITNYNVVVVNDKASLQNINVTNNIAVALVKGKYGMNDGWEGQFTFNAASTAVADDAFYVAPNTGVGMWERQTPNPLREIPATWFDPNLTNGVIQAAINYAASLSTNAVPGREVLLPPKFIEINGNTGLNMSNNVTLVGQNGTVLATSAGTVAGYQMIRANGVTNWGVKNLQLIGLASVSGYGIYVTNSDHGAWGGITFATNFTAAPVWITNSSSIEVFDDKWIKNSVRGYGAVGNGTTIDTLPFTMALYNTYLNAGEVIHVPRGKYPVALYITNSNEILEGVGTPIVDSTFTNATLVNASTNAYIITTGTDWAGGVTNLQKGTMLRNLQMNAEQGPNGVGPGCLLWQGGTYMASIYSCGFFGGWDYTLKHTAGTNQQALFIDYYSCRGQAGDTGNGFIYANGRLGLDTGVRFTECFFSGSDVSGHAVVADSEKIYFNQVWIQCANMHGVLLTNASNPAAVAPGIVGEGTIDSNSSLDILVEGFNNNNLLGSYLYPHIDVDGKFLLANGTVISNLGIRDFTKGETMLIIPHLWGAMDLEDSATYTTSDHLVRFGRSGSAAQLQNDAGAIFMVPKNNFTVEATNGLPTFNLLGIDNKNTLSAQVSSLPVDGNTFTINGNVLTWRNVTNTPATELLIGTDEGASATNLWQHFVDYAIPGCGCILTLNFTPPDTVLIQEQLNSVTYTNTGSWLTASTNWVSTVATHSFYSSDATNFSIQSFNKLYLRNTNGDATVTLTENAKNGLVTINNNGFGINRSVSGQASLAVDGEATLGINPSITTTKLDTNATSSTFTRIEAMIQPFPLVSGTNTDSAGVFHAFYGYANLVSAYTNNLTGNPSLNPFRSQVAHHGSGVVSQSVGYFVQNPVVDGGGTISNFVGFRADVDTSTNGNRFGFYSVGTATNRFNGAIGIGKDATAALDVVGDAIVTGTYRLGGINGPTWTFGSGAPSADAPVGSFYSDTSGGVGTTFYVKEVAGAGAGNWKAK